MFDDQTTPAVNSPAPSPQAPNNEVVDIFEGIDKQPAVNAPSAKKTSSPISPVYSNESHGGKKHKIIFLVIIVIVVMALVYVAGKIYFMQSNVPTAPVENLSPIVQPDEEEILFDEQPMIEQSSIDSDSDGLTDLLETQYSTNPLKADTDSDDLSDYDEAIVYKTNPLNPDTDGDSFLDGDEVRHGYNPKGPGKLLNFQDALNKLNNEVNGTR